LRDNFRQHFRCQGWSEIFILFFDQGHSIVALGFLNLVVWWFATRIMPNRSSPFGAVRLQQTKHLSLGHIQHVRTILDAQPSVINLCQNLDTVQIPLAACYPWQGE
jgi:hypothetical protein